MLSLMKISIIKHFLLLKVNIIFHFFFLILLYLW